MSKSLEAYCSCRYVTIIHSLNPTGQDGLVKQKKQLSVSSSRRRCDLEIRSWSPKPPSKNETQWRLSSRKVWKIRMHNEEIYIGLYIYTYSLWWIQKASNHTVYGQTEPEPRDFLDSIKITWSNLVAYWWFWLWKDTRHLSIIYTILTLPKCPWQGGRGAGSRFQQQQTKQTKQIYLPIKFINFPISDKRSNCTTRLFSVFPNWQNHPTSL